MYIHTHRYCVTYIGMYYDTKYLSLTGTDPYGKNFVLINALECWNKTKIGITLSNHNENHTYKRIIKKYWLNKLLRI